MYTMPSQALQSSTIMQDQYGLKQKWKDCTKKDSMPELEEKSQSLSFMETSEPPFQRTYKPLLENFISGSSEEFKVDEAVAIEECDLPLIDLSRLNLGEKERAECKREIAKAAEEWGFFQVVNHGISRKILEEMRCEQKKVFKRPYSEKIDHNFMNFPPGSYRWGTPSATSLWQVSWSEAFHVPLADIAGSSCLTSSLSWTMERFATTASELAQRLAEILAEEMGNKSTFFKENCLPSTCYLRLNRYPPCPISSRLFGLMPHTDSDFLTILHQDQIGGLQLVKDEKWSAVKPNPESLIINIGDLFQAWSNGVYRSVQHRVVTNKATDRFSTAYFLCPSYETMIKSCLEPSIYRSFSFGEFRSQVQQDVQKFGYKIGLPKFLV